MSKAVLVMDMPGSCWECRLNNDYGFCSAVTQRNLSTGPYYDRRSENCPLRPLPEKKQICFEESDYGHGITKGWNACIDEVIGESEI